jgi:NAD(P)H dehydrogenase (quinone)
MILVTAAAGHLGRAIVAEILAKVPPYQLAVTTRHPAEVALLARKGVSVRKADYADPQALQIAFRDVEALLMLSSDADVASRTAQHENVIEAAKLAGVSRVVYTSFLDSDPSSPFPYSAAHEATEDALRSSGLAWTILRVNDFAESLVEGLDMALQSGIYPNAAPRGRASYVSRSDVAQAAAAALISDAHDHMIYELTGPAALSGEDIASILSTIAGRPIVAQTTPVRDYVTHLKEMGVRDYHAEAIGGMKVAIDEGRLQKVSEDIKSLTGQPANVIHYALRTALAQRRSHYAN